jgi:hypothetical protein
VATVVAVVFTSSLSAARRDGPSARTPIITAATIVDRNIFHLLIDRASKNARSEVDRARSIVVEMGRILKR